ncbi:MAG: hypothetical protein DPW09_05455 [Anaerolineae bacterium]|nr:DUF2029 domain-containing protein [Anaerolineales bacterium]MCQ3972881.1 hypothetical protein [Anaerolineae bacterium]
MTDYREIITFYEHQAFVWFMNLVNLINITHIRRLWFESKVYRRILLATLIYLMVRLALQGVVLAQVWSAGPVASETTLISNDLQIYMAAANRLVNGQELYLQEALDKIAVFQYAPAFALVLTPLLPVPFGLLAALHTLLIIGCYGLLYLWWGRIFRRLGLDRAEAMLAWTLPVWIVFAAFWGDLAYLNIYIITALVCTLLIEAVLDERLGWALLWVSLLLSSKPYLAFPLALPLILGRFRFFWRLLAGTVAIYGAVMGLTILLMGPAYGWAQHLAYLRFLAEMTANFPWRTPESGFLGYNHSILQITFFLLGVTPAAQALATGLKVLLLLPLAGVSLRHLLHSTHRPGRETPLLSLDLAFALCTGAFIWLDIVWELTLGAVIFAYLLATLTSRSAKIWAWAVFLPYALLDVWQVISFVALGPAILADGFYVWTDPSIYLPLVMLVILVFHALLVKRLWSASYASAEKQTEKIPVFPPIPPFKQAKTNRLPHESQTDTL